METLSNLSISKKMALLSGIGMTALLTVGVFSFWVIYKLSADIDDLSDVQIVAMRATMQADMMHDGLRAVVFRALLVTPSTDAAEREDTAKELEEFSESFRTSLKKLDELPMDSASKQAVKDAFPALEAYIAKADEITKLALSGQGDKAQKSIGDFQKEFKILEDRMEKLDSMIEKNADASQAKAGREIFLARVTMGVVSVLGFLLVLGLSSFISRSIASRLKALSEVVGRLSAKNIEEKVDCRSNDEIGVVSRALRDAFLYLSKVADAAEGLSRGHFDVELAARSEDDMLSKNFLVVTETLQKLIAETSELTKGAKSGDLSCRGNADQFKGGFRDLITNINDTLNSIAEPINEASAVLEKMAGRDLTAKMEGNYFGDFAKIKTSVNLAADNLKDGFEQVLTSADQVASAAEQISQGSQSLAHGASDQASSLEEVASSLQEISSMTRQNAVNSAEARSLSGEARHIADNGLANMRKLNNAVERIKTSSDSTAKIVKTIEEIAFQTNLLALNAAVEAARAGDAGKGFAVVAEEVRNLAMRSAEAARSSATMIDEAVANTSEGVALNAAVFKDLEEINTQIEKVSCVVTEIAGATEQQSLGVEQINKAVERMNLVTQQIAANSEESASSAEELSSQSQEMVGLITTYKLDEHTRASVKVNFTPKLVHKTNPVPAIKTTNASKTKKAAKPTVTTSAPRPAATSGAEMIPFDDFDSDGLSDF